ncbi:hypothetical protein IE53DRAFT_366381 [Violaceomyces palustris]|uniref:Uncharacterized protein n=1 Tax=Violaceomyces palustris TaxID=1673888 RepID=A0ACD0P5T6_9BASI|nr:hypothetical protein IE53DRAFT_366381 [Violaceomyces palustris]
MWLSWRVLLSGAVATLVCGFKALLQLLTSPQNYSTTIMARKPDTFQTTLSQRNLTLASSSSLTNELHMVQGDARRMDAGLFSQGSSYLACVMRPLYGYLFHEPHFDKEHMKSHLHDELAGLHSKDFNDTQDPQQQHPKVEQLVIIRTALLVNGDPPSRSLESQSCFRGHAYTICRSDVGHFVYNSVLGGQAPNWIKRSAQDTGAQLNQTFPTAKSLT